MLYFTIDQVTNKKAHVLKTSVYTSQLFVTIYRPCTTLQTVFNFPRKTLVGCTLYLESISSSTIHVLHHVTPATWCSSNFIKTWINILD